MRVVVVGGGVAGLTAAHDLSAAGHEVVVLEGADEIGGKIRRREVAGITVDVGAEAMLNRRPEGIDLARSLGLGIEHPTLASSRIWTRGALRPLPRSLMGVPLDLGELAASGVLSDEALDRVRREPTLGPERIVGDVSVGELVDRRFGAEVTDRLVEPLLGGVYAGRARELSARASVPQLVAFAERGSLLEQAATIPTTYDTPVFAGIPGGMGLLVETLAAGLDVRTGVQVREIRQVGGGYEVSTSSTTGRASSTTGRASSTTEAADAVVVAVPAAPAARLLSDLAPAAAAELSAIEHASMAVVTFAYSVDDVEVLDATGSSGFLVPPVDGHRIKASTFSFAKWAWTRRAGAEAGVAHLRTSIGRHREAASLQVTDEELVAVSLADLREAVGLAAVPVAAHVQRWGGGLPQYAVGHLDRVARIRADVARVPGLAVCGAAYDGVGIPAVIGSAHRAAKDIATG